jgi:uncharacterized protein YndB with AHSA1/START domain
LKWWRIEGRFQAVEVECDLRPGGRWMMRVSGGCGMDSNSMVAGEYRAIEPPRLLIYTWVREQEDAALTVVRWDLEEANGVTRVRLTHSGLTSEALRSRNGGWPMVLGLLKGFMLQPGPSGQSC